jgi:hypothetical protein
VHVLSYLETALLDYGLAKHIKSDDVLFASIPNC